MASKEILIEKVFSAPKKIVWDVWNKPEHIENWWGPGQGVKTRVEEFDFNVGGRWKYVMLMPNNNEFPLFGEFLEIVEGEKVVTTDENPFPEIKRTLTITFEELEENKTKVVMEVIGATEEFQEKLSQMQLEKGWGSNFDSMERYVNSL